MKLKEIDLTRGSKSRHPDIKSGHWYLALIGNAYFCGQFNKVWYGWSFDDNWSMSGHQFDTPGSNGSLWKRLWQLQPQKKKRKKK